MTFKEYVNQEDPIRFPKVYLTEDDFEMCLMVHTNNPRKVWEISLKMFGEYYRYQINEGDNIVWTMDEDGNKRSSSCFRFNGILS
jgi:hypothetical protein